MMEGERNGSEATHPPDTRPGHGAGPFVEAVIGQLARGFDAAGAGAQQQVDALADRLARVLVACEQNDAEPVVATLTDDLLLLSAVFQNIDLLYTHDYPYSDAMSMLTLEAVHRAVEADEG